MISAAWATATQRSWDRPCEDPKNCFSVWYLLAAGTATTGVLVVRRASGRVLFHNSLGFCWYEYRHHYAAHDEDGVGITFVFGHKFGQAGVRRAAIVHHINSNAHQLFIGQRF